MHRHKQGHHKKLVKLGLKRISQSLFVPISSQKCMFEDESYFTMKGKEWQGFTWVFLLTFCQPITAEYEIKSTDKFKNRTTLSYHVSKWIFPGSFSVQILS
jgi:hypothetical protein